MKEKEPTQLFKIELLYQGKVSKKKIYESGKTFLAGKELHKKWCFSENFSVKYYELVFQDSQQTWKEILWFTQNI